MDNSNVLFGLNRSYSEFKCEDFTILLREVDDTIVSKLGSFSSPKELAFNATTFLTKGLV